MSQPTQPPVTATPAVAHPRELLARAGRLLRLLLAQQRLPPAQQEQLAEAWALVEQVAEARRVSAPACEPGKLESLSSSDASSFLKQQQQAALWQQEINRRTI